MEAQPADTMFRCEDLNHGVTFIPHEDTFLKSQLEKLRALDVQNILILGETGVGKSTWINGIANYLLHENIDSAIENGPLILIPAKFTFIKDDGTMIDVQVGENMDNEDMTVGSSCTQEPTTYSFTVGNQMINLIDTPGIGDTRGQDQDKKNFEKILHHLSYFEEIHAICILLKPNNAKMGVVFKFCIQELLAHLHRDAARNILFCFTNTRGTDYRPGDTLPVLKKLLKSFGDTGLDATPYNWFCFDNEAIRFLARVLNKLPYSEEEKATYATSWAHSVKETMKVFNHPTLKNPHRIMNTTSVNDARRTIVTLAKPMAAFIAEINKNIKAMEDTQKVIADKDVLTKDLQTKLTFNGTTIEKEDLGHPRTVCTDSSCTEFKSENIDEKQIRNVRIFKQHCHSHCHLSGVDVDAIGAQGLYNCAAMTNGKCNQCGHMWDQHMHLRYELKPVTKAIISQGVKSRMKEVASEKEKMIIYKKELDDKVNQFKKEHDNILQMSAQFGAYLKKNAIIPYNDAVADYLDFYINEEAQKDAKLRDASKLQKMRDSKANYEQQKSILDEALKEEVASDKIPSTEEVKVMTEKLFKMDHFGRDIKKVFTAIDTEAKNTNSFKQVNVSTMANRQKKKSTNPIQNVWNWMTGTYDKSN
jgi:GTPase SAR1 family protein